MEIQQLGSCLTKHTFRWIVGRAKECSDVPDKWWARYVLPTLQSHSPEGVFCQTRPQLLRVNATLQEITTIGFIFGPIFAPLLTYTFHNDAILFYIDAATFFIAATLLGQCFKSTTLPNEAIDSAPSNFNFDIIESLRIFKDKLP